jgi:hypothetical protein
MILMQEETIYQTLLYAHQLDYLVAMPGAPIGARVACHTYHSIAGRRLWFISPNMVSALYPVHICAMHSFGLAFQDLAITNGDKQAQKHFQMVPIMIILFLSGLMSIGKKGLDYRLHILNPIAAFLLCAFWQRGNS